MSCFETKEEMKKMKKGIVTLFGSLVLMFSIILIGKTNVSAAPLRMPDGTIFDPV